VSGDGNEKLLGVPKVASGTGENEANAVYDLLQKWQLSDAVQAMCFDITSVNTGRLNGVCVRIEHKFGRELTWLACRHHIMEIIPSKVFTMCFGPSSSPDMPLFKKFKSVWSSIDKTSFSGLQIKAELSDLSGSTITFLQRESLSEQLRDDYKELVELTQIVLGSPPSKIHWRAPGAVHRTRWMAKLIYAVMIFLFCHQEVVILTDMDEKQIERFVHFGALIYTKAWS
jgi:hypothetical protein